MHLEDYDLLNKLDERVSKKNTMGRQSAWISALLKKSRYSRQTDPHGFTMYHNV